MITNLQTDTYHFLKKVINLRINFRILGIIKIKCKNARQHLIKICLKRSISKARNVSLFLKQNNINFLYGDISVRNGR